MGQLQQRIIAMSGAILFIISTVGISVVMIITTIQDGKKQAAERSLSQKEACQQPTGTLETLEAPEAFVPEGDVTELQTTDIVEGSGRAAKEGDCLIMKYYGTLATDGTMFDENFTQPSGFAFKLGRGQVIQGWEQGLVGLKEGGIRRLVIPSEMAYGEQAQGDKIPANSDLVFTVKLVEIQK